MTMNTVGPIPHPRFPLSGVTPFTYRDGWTYLEVLENFRTWIRDELVPIVNDNADKMEAAYEAALLVFLEAVNDFNEFKTEINSTVVDLRDAAQTVQDIFDDLQTNGPVVSIDGQHGIVELDGLIRNYTRTGELPVGRDELTINALDHGAVGDGTTDDTAALQALVQAAAPGSTILLPANHTFRITDVIDLANSITIDATGATIDATDMPAGQQLRQRFAFRIAGTLSDPVGIVAPISHRSRTVNVDDAGLFDVGDLIQISNNEPHMPGASPTNVKGELNVVTNIQGNTLTLGAGTLFDYAATGLQARKVDAVEGTQIVGATIRMGGVGSVHNGIHIQYARNVAIDRVTVIGAEDVGIRVATAWGTSVTNCDIRDSTTPTVGNTGYGIAVMEGSRYIAIENNRFTNCKCFVSGGGRLPAAHVNITGNHGHGSLGAGYDCHEPSYYWNFRNNTAVGVVEGILVRGQHCTIDGNTVTEASANGIRVHVWDSITEQTTMRCTNNVVETANMGITVDGTSGGGLSVDSINPDVLVNGNTVTNAAYRGVRVRRFNRANVQNNTVHGDTHTSIECIEGNDLNASGNTASGGPIRIEDVTGATVTALSVIDSTGAAGLFIESCSDISINNCSSKRGVFAGLRLNNTQKATVTGGAYTESTGENGDGISVVNCTDVTITGTLTADNPRNGIRISGTDHVQVVANNTRRNPFGVHIDGATNQINEHNLEP